LESKAHIKVLKRPALKRQKSLHLRLISVPSNPQATCFSEVSIFGTGIRNGAVSAIKTQIKSTGWAIAADTGPKFSNRISAIEEKITLIIDTAMNAVHAATTTTLRF
jgi:protein-disulfide isomerase-like protein with CxxC motif